MLFRSLRLACLAPSVGHAQPWRFIVNESAERRSLIAANYASANQHALDGYKGEQKQHYAKLKLSGLQEAPVQIGVLCDEATAHGHGLGRMTMPEMLCYSVVCAVHTFWLAARLRGLGVGWISILDPAAALAALSAPENHTLVAYLCVGWPQAESQMPELEREGWQQRLDHAQHIWTLR